VNPSANLAEHIDGLIGTLILQGQARFRLDPVAPEPAPTPLRLFEPIRRMAELTREDDEASIFNLWHEALLLSPVDRHVVPLLDGSRDRDALLEALLAIDREHEITIDRDGEPVSGEVERLQAFSEYVDALPPHLEEMKLLRVGLGPVNLP
jgi:hypothetical protein